jgi:tetratricopeptide (TPR) repeat protein
LLVDRINLLAAKTQYLAKRFEVATAAFQQIAHSNSPSAKVALLNASAGWLQLGDHERFVANYNELQEQGVDEESRASLRLEEALMQASKGDNQAAKALQQFIRDFPKNPRLSEAWVSLAELAYPRRRASMKHEQIWCARPIRSRQRRRPNARIIS